MSHLRQYFSFGSPPFPLESSVIKTRTLSKSASPRTGAHWSAKVRRTSASANQQGGRVIIGPCDGGPREPCLGNAQRGGQASVRFRMGFQKGSEIPDGGYCQEIYQRQRGARKGLFGAVEGPGQRLGQILLLTRLSRAQRTQ